MTAASPADPPGPPAADPQGSVPEVGLAFLKLGLTAFGGPVAHIGYFRREFVDRRRWLDDAQFADLLALCQFLPGPASSKLGLALGLSRAGYGGALAAWLGFTLPSALLMLLLAWGVAGWLATPGTGALALVHGLKLAAVAVVAQAVWAMARSLCPDRPRAALAFAATVLVLALPAQWGPLAALLLGAVAGRWLLPTVTPALSAAPFAAGAAPDAGTNRPGLCRLGGGLLLGLYGVLLLALPTGAALSTSPLLAALSVFYGAGALVFGGGHVVLPLLQAGVVPPGWIGNEAFLAGYGAAQALPGPLFTFAAYLGAAMAPPLGGWGGGLLALLAIFAPAFLLTFGALPFWHTLRRRPGVRRSLAGINAAVVGLLAAALYDPVWTSAVHSRVDVALALAAFALLGVGRLSPVIVVGATALAGWAWAGLG